MPVIRRKEKEELTRIKGTTTRNKAETFMPRRELKDRGKDSRNPYSPTQLEQLIRKKLMAASETITPSTPRKVTTPAIITREDSSSIVPNPVTQWQATITTLRLSTQ